MWVASNYFFSLTASALAPVLEDIYFDSNGVLFRNGVAIVDQHGSIIRRPIAERPLPVFRPTFVDPETSSGDRSKRPSNRAAAVPLIQEVQSHPALRVSAVDSSGDAQMRPASETRGRLTGDPLGLLRLPACITKRTYPLFLFLTTLLVPINPLRCWGVSASSPRF
ncbi:hypothetical protein PCANC_08912 [Puccinia coronata f. sp. avenae]|uniref:CN hydrolase domain-containing protein n=1 Tax=Puccinia coronata f. sp. avenae TaxID=200324 RepID=A0A2N5VS43_9BASI|nr:hypothetical protein PCANC_08912 [Puccinia coronata f. sp. avenae]